MQTSVRMCERCSVAAIGVIGQHRLWVSRRRCANHASSVREALKNGVAIGAHPSFPDRENFGRSAMTLPAQTVYAQTLYQIGALAAITRAEGGVMHHVKPHGMLYNRAAKDPQLADAIAKAVHACDPSLILVGLAGSELIRAGEHYGTVTRQEVFADRGYQADGSLGAA